MRLLTLTLPPERPSAAALRVWLRNLLVEAQVPQQASREIVLAAEEVLSNAILHSGQRGGDLTIMVSILADSLYLTVSDRGQGFATELLAGRETVGAAEAAGLGLTLVHALMDEVTLNSGGEGTSIRLVKQFLRRNLHSPGEAFPD
jgi:anti-sigma regulatory factor (Ser/Thr protein kinase)